MSAAADALRLARETLAGRPAWLVGGAVRDRLLGRATTDLDLAVDGDVRAAARALAKAAGGPVFELSDAFGAWRVMAPDRSWQADLTALRGATLEEDLALRDFTVNAIAEPLAGGDAVDPHGGAEDLRAGRLRAVGPRALADDPLRVMRAARLAVTLGLRIDDATAAAARAEATGLTRVAGERVFAELRGIVGAQDPVRGLELLDELGALAVVLPELEGMKGVEQTRYHHRDVFGHTLEVLAETVALERDLAGALGAEHAGAVAALLAEPLADELTRGAALRFGALLHDAAKPATQVPLPQGGYGFPGHDREGAGLARAVLARLRASERLRAYVAGLARHHLRLGFLVHERPLGARSVFRYLAACEPLELDVTLLSVADRLATRGRNADEAIARHLELAREILPAALAWGRERARPPLVRGDELAAELGIAPGPALGELLAQIAEARYAGEVSDRAGAVALAARLRTG